MTRQYRNDGRDQIPIENVHGNVYIQEGSRPTRSRSESLLLDAVRKEVISRLNQSLHNAVFIHLGKQAQPQQVRRPLDAEIKIGSRSPEALPAETTILEVFDRSGIDGGLLILGEPGAGKTTTMLDLAKGLCDRAEQDATAFIPVLLNLSSWQDPKQTMTAWLVAELQSKYGVRKDIGTQWLAEKQLLPLLDGLDEVKPEHQEGCVQAINRWLESEDRPPSLAVCCRREEYEKVVRGQWQVDAEAPQNTTRMHLNGAILLQTLTDEQIQTYLTAANQPELWRMLRHDEALWSLIRTPLWLSITLLSYEGLSLNQWQQTVATEQRLSLLLDAYVERMLHKELNFRAYAKRKPPAAKHVRQWLTYLAHQLQYESQMEFLIERMQPFWLKNKIQKRIYLLENILSGGLLFGLISELIGRFFPAPATRLNLFEGVSWWNLTVNLIVCSFVGLIIGLGGEEIKAFETLTWSWNKAREGFFSVLRAWLVAGLIVGLLALLFAISIALVSGLFDLSRALFASVLMLIFGLIWGLTFGIFFGAIFGLIRGMRGSYVDIRKVPNQGIWNSLMNAAIIWLIIGLFIGSVVGLISGLIGGWSQVLPWGVSYELNYGFVGSIMSGGKICIQHFNLRLILFRSGSIPWNYARFLNYCTERLFLQRVGGRYRFIHKSLQEHFAAMRE